MMFRLLVILTLDLLHTSLISSTGSQQDSHTLPLILIKSANVCFYPKQIVKTGWIVQDEILSGGTVFSDGMEGQLIFSCASKTLTKAEQTDLVATKSGNTDKYCSYPTRFKETDALRCIHEPQPLAEKIIRSLGQGVKEEMPCGPEQRGKMYWFVYKTCFIGREIQNDVKFNKKPYIMDRNKFEVYRFCFDEDQSEVMYTKHRIMAPQLLFDGRLKHERDKQYEMMTHGYKSFSTHYEEVKKQYDQMEKENPKDITPSQVHLLSKDPQKSYKIQKLVPHEDLAFALWKKTTYHYLNVKPMQQNHIALWNHISELIRKDASKNNRQYEIYTRTLTDPKSVKTHPGRDLQAPESWLKMIHYFYQSKEGNNSVVRYKALAIILDTNHEDNSEEIIYKSDCPENLCENAFHVLFPKIGKSVRCCPVTDIMRKIFDIEFDIDFILGTGFLFDHADASPNIINNNK